MSSSRIPAAALAAAWLISATVAVATLSPGSARADDPAPQSPPSVFALPIGDPGAAPQVEAIAAEPGAGFASDRGVPFDAVRYVPRHGGYGRYEQGPRRALVNQLHAGFFDPDGSAKSTFLLGYRGGIQIDDNVLLGVGVDWNHKSEDRSQVISTQPGPGGQTITTELQLSRSSSNLVPIEAFLQFSGSGNLAVVPYIGAAGGYQVLFLSADDLQTGLKYDATFGGWGWQLWGGAAWPLSGRSRLNAEAFLNGATVERDVEDVASGLTFRESVKMNGVGMRFGLQWGF